MADWVDFESLEKGQTLSASTLERLFGEDRGSSKYAFKAMALIDQIKRARPDLYPCQKNCAIVIMTDAQAALYSVDRAKQTLRSLVRQSKDDSRVNPQNLGEHARASFEAGRQVKAHMAIGAAGDLRKLRIAEALRLTVGKK